MELLRSDYYKKHVHYKDLNWAYVKLEIVTLLHEYRPKCLKLYNSEK